jgi:bile acid-coenzyme A ligase
MGVAGLPPMEEVSYGRRLTEIAAERPDDIDLILVDRDGTERGATWRELETRANQIARELQSHGVDAGDLVALALPTCLEHILVTLAIWKLGATLVPLRYDVPAWEIERLLAMAQPKVLVSDTEHPGWTTVSRSDLAATVARPADPLDDRISACVNLIASSGSTGRPKLIVAPYRGVVADDVQNALMHGGLVPTTLVVSPLYHINGFNYAAPTILEGGRAIVMEKFDAALAVRLIQRHRITFSVMVPTMLQRIARLDDVDPAQLQTIQRLIYGGAKVPEWVIDRWLELIDPKMFQFVYGSSERIGAVMMSGEEWPAHRGAAGAPQDVEVSIRDSDGKPVSCGQVGEIFMRPLQPRRMFRYIGAPTPEPTSDGFYTIGDLGRVDDDGYLYIADRRSDLIISGGANVFPAEVETALSEHPGVVDQVVVGVRDDEWGQRVHAIVQPVDAQHPPSAEALRSFCRERLSAYKVPKTYEIVAVLPRSEAGKLNRTALAEERSR